MVAIFITQRAQYDFWAINILYILFSVWTKWLSDGCRDKFLKIFLKDTDVTKQKFISQLVIQDETWMRNFDSEIEQQSMQWNERIGQNIVISLQCVTTPFSRPY